ncbi:MAG: MotA/TolQ/ExbB proton channel family protein [Candidatus Omnitrophota bacterium]
MSTWQLFRTGGFTLIILLFCSIVSLAIIIERYLYYRRRSRVKRLDFMKKVRKELEKGSVETALSICKKSDTPFSSVVYAGLSFYNHSEKEISNNMDREIVVETTTLERFTAIIGTIASVAVYIGLFGTVLGIMRVFHDLSASGTGGVGVVINGISEALVTTAAGLCVAVPAITAYNYFIKKIDSFIKDMELCASETMDLTAPK